MCLGYPEDIAEAKTMKKDVPKAPRPGWIRLDFPTSPEWNGYLFKKNGRYKIKWTGGNLKTIDIFLTRNGKIESVLAENIPIENGGGINQWGTISGALDWLVPEELEPADNYMIEIQEHLTQGEPKAWDCSGLVSIE